VPQRLIAALLGVLGAGLIALGVASATVWRADDILVATAKASGATLLVTDPGVLSLIGKSVTVTAQAPAQGNVVIAIGRDTDVAGWVASDPHTQVTGLAGWHALATKPVGTAAASSPSATPTEPSPEPAVTGPAAGAATAPAAVAAAAPAPDPTGSDMWVAQASGPGTASLTWTDQPGRWRLLVASTGPNAGPPTVRLAWPQVVTTPWLVPCVVSGALLLLVAAWLILRRRWWARGGLRVAWNAVDSGETPTVTGPTVVVPATGVAVGSAPEPGAPLTRRQMREIERTAPIPLVAPRLSLRRREPSETGAGPSSDTGPTAIGSLSSSPAPVSTPPGPVWSSPSAPVPPPGPSAPVPSPGSSAAVPRPGPSAAVPRPGPSATVPPAVPSAPVPPPGPGQPLTGTAWSPEPPAPADDAAVPPVAGPRADAWRRAWGFPGRDTAEESEAVDDDGKDS
jgi:hypothetical protein